MVPSLPLRTFERKQCTPGQCNCKSCHNGADKNAQASSSACSCVAKDSEGYVRGASSYPPRERRLTSRPLFAHCSPLRPSPLCLRLRYLPSASVVRCNGIAVHQSSVTSCSCTSKADCKCGDSCTCASCGKDSKKDSTGCACSYVPVSPNRSETMFASQEADGGIYVLQGEVQVHDQLCLRRRLQVHQLPFEEGAVSRPAYIHCAASRPSSRNSLPFEPTLMLPAFVPTFALVPVPLAFSTL